jgi:predicted DNA-binding transcriptional regulator AlpA
MRFISWKELKLLVPYSRQYIFLLEQQGKFPRRLRLRTGPKARVAWVEAEVLEWMAQRLQERDDLLAEAAQ